MDVDKERETPLAPVSILAGAMYVTFQIKPGEEGLLEYVTNHENPEEMLEDAAYRSWTQYMASADLIEIMTVDRVRAAEEMQARLQAESDERKLGLKILQVGLIGMHPPVDVAPSFEQAINALKERDAKVWTAVGQARKRVEEARGNAEQTLARARGDGFAKVAVERARADRFESQLKGYTAAPEVYRLRHYLDLLASATEEVRKFVVAVANPNKVQVIVNDEEKLPPGLLGLTEELAQQKSSPTKK